MKQSNISATHNTKLKEYVQCINCKEYFWRYLHRRNYSQKPFCSFKCVSQYQKGKNNPNYKNGKQKTSCDFCGKIIRRNPSQVKKYRRHFCSAKCREVGKRTWLECKCEYCNKIIYRPKSYIEKHKHIFCNRSCRQDWMYGANNTAWRGGVKSLLYCPVWDDEEYKKDIKERDGNICLNPECRRRNQILTLHHIDYNKKNCHPWNLITLCRSCNSRANVNREWYIQWYQRILHNRYGYEYKKENENVLV